MKHFEITCEEDKTLVIQSIREINNYPQFVTIKKLRKIRTIDQNKMYWSILGCISEETGNEAEDLHTYFKRTYLGHKVRSVLGEKILIVLSTTNLDTKEFSDYISCIIRWAGGEGIAIPMPGDERMEEFVNQYYRRVG